MGVCEISKGNPSKSTLGHLIKLGKVFVTASNHFPLLRNYFSNLFILEIVTCA